MHTLELKKKMCQQKQFFTGPFFSGTLVLLISFPGFASKCFLLPVKSDPAIDSPFVGFARDFPNYPNPILFRKELRQRLGLEQSHPAHNINASTPEFKTFVDVLFADLTYLGLPRKRKEYWTERIENIEQKKYPYLDTIKLGIDYSIFKGSRRPVVFFFMIDPLIEHILKFAKNHIQDKMTLQRLRLQLDSIQSPNNAIPKNFTQRFRNAQQIVKEGTSEFVFHEYLNESRKIRKQIFGRLAYRDQNFISDIHGGLLWILTTEEVTKLGMIEAYLFELYPVEVTMKASKNLDGDILDTYEFTEHDLFHGMTAFTSNEILKHWQLKSDADKITLLNAVKNITDSDLKDLITHGVFEILHENSLTIQIIEKKWKKDFAHMLSSKFPHAQKKKIREASKWLENHLELNRI